MPKFDPLPGLGLFAGIRPAEQNWRGWETIDLERAIVTVDTAASKLRQRRIVNLEPVAVEWLRLGRDAAQLPLRNLTRQTWLRRLLPVLGFEKWPMDLLRHTAASYLLDKYEDTWQVALVCSQKPS